jgi:hypothetical protein
MHQLDFIGILAGGFAVLTLPFILPLFFYRGVQRRTLFYFVGLACSFLCYKVANFLWALSAFAIGSLLASWRHEGFEKSTEYSFAVVAPGLHGWNMFFAILPMLTLGTLLSVFVLRKLKRALFRASGSVELS